MKAYQIFQSLSPATGKALFQELRDDHKEIYKTTLVSLAQQKRLRPVFIQRKPVEKQIEWMLNTSKLKVADGVGEHVLQVWLLKAKQDMLIEFLDALGIEHDDDGTVDDLPDEIDSKKLKAAVDKLLDKYEREYVVLYLHMFQLQRPEGWAVVQDLLDNDDRLYFGDTPPAKEPEPAPAKEEAAAPAEEPAAAAEEVASAEKEVS